MNEYMKAVDQGQKVALRNLGEAHVKNWGDESKTKLSLAKRALKLNDPDGELSKMLSESGYGNHPAVLNFLARLGENLKEGGFLPSALNVQDKKKSIAQKLYPTMKK